MRFLFLKFVFGLLGLQHGWSGCLRNDFCNAWKIRHELSQYTEISTKSQKQSFANLAITMKNYEIIIDMDFVNYFNHTTELLSKLFLHKWPKFVFEIQMISLNFTKASFTKMTHFQFLHVCVYISWIFSYTWLIMTPKRCCHARIPQNRAYIFFIAFWWSFCHALNPTKLGWTLGTVTRP